VPQQRAPLSTHGSAVCAPAPSPGNKRLPSGARAGWGALHCQRLHINAAPLFHHTGTRLPSPSAPPPTAPAPSQVTPFPPHTRRALPPAHIVLCCPQTARTPSAGCSSPTQRRLLTHPSPNPYPLSAVCCCPQTSRTPSAGCSSPTQRRLLTHPSPYSYPLSAVCCCPQTARTSSAGCSSPTQRRGSRSRACCPTPGSSKSCRPMHRCGGGGGCVAAWQWRGARSWLVKWSHLRYGYNQMGPSAPAAPCMGVGAERPWRCHGRPTVLFGTLSFASLPVVPLTLYLMSKAALHLFAPSGTEPGKLCCSPERSVSIPCRK